MLKLENIWKYLGSFCLQEITFELPDGYILGLIGENGAGKTTLLRLLAGLYTKDEGSIVLDNIPYENLHIPCQSRLQGAQSGSCDMPYAEAEEAVKQKIGAVFHGDLFDVRDTLRRNARRYGQYYRDYDDRLMECYMADFHLDAGKKYGLLSKGEKLKFAFAFALSHKPKLLLLDEPAANFDRDFREIFRDALRKYTENGENSAILSTHITSDIDRIADYLLYLEKGRQVIYGDIESIRGNYRMVAGEEYKIRLLKERIVHLEKGEFGAKALVRNSGRPYDSMLKVWEPSIEEWMYHMAKKKTEKGAEWAYEYRRGHV